jgi:hypothetical protein
MLNRTCTVFHRMAFPEGPMAIATFSAIATTTGEVIRMIGALNGMIFATATIACGAGSVTIGKRRMIGERAFVPMKPKQEVLQETVTEAMRMTEAMQMTAAMQMRETA